MTVEELLKPRYKVIADYPNSRFNVGDILVRIKYATSDWFQTNENDLKSGLLLSEIIEYPHLFKPLKWYEERKSEDMPKYVKLVMANRNQFVHKVEKWNGENMNYQPLYEYFNKVKYLSTACVSDLLPATEQEYIDYQNTLTPLHRDKQK